MRKKVLVALDGSPAAAVALPLARTVAGQLDADLEAVHVASAAKPSEEVRVSLGLDAAEAVDIPVRVLVGDPVEELLRATSRRDVAVTVLATHGHEIGKARSIAHVPEALAANATRPILLVRPEAAAVREEQPPPFSRLLLPLDGRAATARALRPAVRLARTLRLGLDLLFVVYPGQTPPERSGGIVTPLYVDAPYYEWPGWEKRARSWLRSCCDDMRTDIPIDVYVQAGDAQKEIGATIAHFAEEHDSNAIVIVRRSHLEPYQEPVARSVLDLAPCPVLVVAGRPHRAQPDRKRAETTVA
jgi:nucleotide-binding universal stress UspA family protein